MQAYLEQLNEQGEPISPRIAIATGNHPWLDLTETPESTVRCHRVSVDKHGVWLRNLGTGSPPFVNGRPIVETLLGHEDVIKSGQRRYRLTIELDAAEKPFTPAETLVLGVPRVFLSCVTSEFEEDDTTEVNKADFPGLKTYLIEKLCHDWSEVKVIHQLNLEYPPDTLLEGLRQWVAKCEFMIHLAGRRDGWKPIRNSDSFRPRLEGWKPEPWEAVRAVYEQVETQAIRLGVLQEAAKELSYTQWELLLARCYNKPVFVCVPRKYGDFDTLITSADLVQAEHLRLIDRIGLKRWSFDDTDSLVMHLKDEISTQKRLWDDKKSHFRELRFRLRQEFEPYNDPGRQISRTPRLAAEKRRSAKNLNFRFYGRQWLYNRVLNWLNGERQVYWLEADAGFGKSSFVTELAQGWQADDSVFTSGISVAAIVFCDPTTGPFQVLRQLCQQLQCSSSTFTEQFHAALDTLPWDKLAIPDDLVTIANDDQRDAIDKLVETLLTRLLLKPLGEAVPTASGKQRLIVIDGLDEVLQRVGGHPFNPLEKLLRPLLAADLPNHRVLVTSRPERLCPELKYLFEKIHVENPEMTAVFAVDGEGTTKYEGIASEMRDDAIGLLRRDLDPTWHDAATIDILLRKSQASMLYLGVIVAMINDANRTPRIVASDVEQLPDGLAGYYRKKLETYFDADQKGRDKFNHVVRPCLEVITATEQVQVTVNDLTNCFGDADFTRQVAGHVEHPKGTDPTGENVIHEFRTSLRALLVETEKQSLLREQGKQIDGASYTVFTPFHLSFMDWLVGRSFIEGMDAEQHDFLINPDEGDRWLAKWAWREYRTLEKVGREVSGFAADQVLNHDELAQVWASMSPPDPKAYWVQHGVNALLTTFEHLRDAELKPAVEPAPGKPAPEQYDYLKHAVGFLGWLNHWIKVERVDKIVSGSLPLLQSVLASTIEDDALLTPEVLDQLERVDQITLFELVKDICSTELIEGIVEWIGRTQLDPVRWHWLVEEILKLDEYVVRLAAAVGQAARFHRYMTDKSLTSEDREQAVAEIDDLLRSQDINRQEMGSFAIGEIIKDPLIRRAKIDERILAWCKKLSSPEFDYYFCPTTLGDLIIDLTLRGFQSEKSHGLLRDLDAYDKKGLFEALWQPIWQYNRQDVIRVLGQWAFHDKRFTRNVDEFQEEVDLEVSLLREREAAIHEFADKAGSDWGPQLVDLLKKPELDSPADDDLIVRWITRDGVALQEQVATAVEYLHLMFTHTAWRVGENASAVIPALETYSHDEQLCNQILASLLDALEGTPQPHYRVFLSSAEACFLSRHFAKSPRHETDSDWPSLIQSCSNKYYHHENCDVRGLFSENICFLVSEQFALAKGDANHSFDELEHMLQRHQPAIDYWQTDSDIWVLEHVYQLFRLAHKHLDAAGPWLSDWVEGRLEHVRAPENSNCLLSRLDLGDETAWYELDRGDFIRQLQTLQKQTPYTPSP